MSTPESDHPSAIQCRVLRITSPFMRGDDVRAVQQALQAKGFNPGTIDGIYGPNTALAVERFRAARGLPVTTVVCGEVYVLLGVACQSVPPCPPPPAIRCRVLRVTHPFITGEDVLAVQQALLAAGFSPGAIDGVYGPATATAVRHFQTARGLPVTGEVCGETYRLLGVACQTIPPCPAPPTIQCRVLELKSPFMSGTDVRAVQQALQERGFNPGQVDGIYGPLTASAVRSFQGARALPVTGIVCGRTYELLGVPCQSIPPCEPGPEQCRVLVTQEPFLAGNDVRRVQEALRAEGLHPGAIDGQYGPHTATAVRQFEAARGLVTTGVVCGNLYRMLGVACPEVPPCPVLPPVGPCRRLAVTSPFLRGSDVAAVQTVLANRGFNPGVVDGVYGPNTAAAVRRLQGAAGLAETGVVCALEYRALLINCQGFPGC